MRTHLRTGVIAGVAVAFVLALPSLAAARSARPHADSRGFSHSRARSILDQVRSALVPGSTARPTARRTDLTVMLLDLRRALPALTPSERASATSLLSGFPPPSSTCGDLLGPPVIVTTHFCVHYVDGNQAWATTTADTLEHVWSVEVDALHFRPPASDGDGLFDVYLQDLGAGYYGACAPSQTSTRHSTSSCVLDDDFDPAQFGGTPAISSLSVTAAHEFFHAIQFGYDLTEDIWLMEGTAVWAEEQVFGSINDYLQYVGFSAIPQPRVPVDYAGVDSGDLYFRYGAVLFWKFLSGQFGDPAIVRRVWEYADGPAYSLQAVAAAVGERGWSFPRTFARFGVWNTKPPGSYDDSSLYPSPPWWQVARLGRGHTRTGRRSVVLDHLTNAAMVIHPARRLPRRTRLRVRVDGPDRVRMPAATVQVRRVDGSVLVVDVPLDATGGGSVLVNFSPRVVSSVVVTLTNASLRMAGCGTDGARRYSCGGQGVDDHQVYAVQAQLRLPRRGHRHARA